MVTQGAVLITGASSGIGKACAVHLDESGFRVFAGVRKPDDAQALAREASSRLTPVFLDVTGSASIAAALETVESAMGEAGLAGLVNNAGVVAAGPMEFVRLEKVRQAIEVNVLGQIAVTQAFLPLLRKGQGRVVNMSSVSGLIAAQLVGPYSISKFALEAFSDVLRRELLPWGIHVAIIEPGRINTPIWEKSASVADDLMAYIPPRAHELYGKALKSFIDSSLDEKQVGTPPEAVARAVAHALTARRPKIRYVVGLDAKVVAVFLKWIPTRWVDKLLVFQRGN
ncbi:MAG: SDR family NAD(P)-dependent oxidoreductase [Chloroflexi bacterium]|nr:SDR family NAD(P)-dependent oxidoreductase [Chloroflexota bacterium]